MRTDAGLENTMIRLIILVLCLLIFAIFSLIALPVLWLVGRRNPVAKEVASDNISRFMFRLILLICGTKTTAIGLENIPTDKPALFVGNHRGFFDVIISYTYIKGRAAYVAKKEMNSVPILRRWMTNIHCVLLDRENTRAALKSILEGIDFIKKGTSLVIFPEGTRNKGEGVMEFHAGSFKLAEKSGCVIIPVTQNNTSAIFEDQKPFLRKAHTVIEFGTPIDMSSMSRDEKKEIAEYVHNIVLTTYNKNQKLV